MFFGFQAWLDFKAKRLQQQLTDTSYNFLFAAPPEQEWVSLDCETTGLDRKKDHIITIAAVKIIGTKIMSSERLNLTLCPPTALKPESIRIHRLREADVQGGLSPEEATEKLLNFIGARPLVGYNIKFDQDMINRLIQPVIGIKLPNKVIDVAPMFHAFRSKQLGQGDIDLSFKTIINTLNLPVWAAHDAYNDALMTALIFLSLQNKNKP